MIITGEQMKETLQSKWYQRRLTAMTTVQEGKRQDGWKINSLYTAF